MLRLRIRHTTWPRPGLILTDTPRPACPDCRGTGGFTQDYGDYDTGEYAGTDYWPCECWDDGRRWLLLPLPRRTRGVVLSDEPPF